MRIAIACGLLFGTIVLLPALRSPNSQKKGGQGQTSANPAHHQILGVSAEAGASDRVAA